MIFLSHSFVFFPLCSFKDKDLTKIHSDICVIGEIKWVLGFTQETAELFLVASGSTLSTFPGFSFKNRYRSNNLSLQKIWSELRKTPEWHVRFRDLGQRQKTTFSCPRSYRQKAAKILFRQ